MDIGRARNGGRLLHGQSMGARRHFGVTFHKETLSALWRGIED